MSGQRSIPAQKIEAVARRLLLSPQKRAQLRQSLQRKRKQGALKKPRKKDGQLETQSVDQTGIQSENNSETPTLDDQYFHLIDTAEHHFQLLSEWEHFGVLCILETENAQSDCKWIAQRLNISVHRVDVVVDRLIALGFLVVENGKFSPCFLKLSTSENIHNSALRIAHQEELTLAAKAIDSVDITLRDFSSLTVACDVNQLALAKEAIRNFRKEIEAILESGPKTEVYQLCIQLFPLSKVNSQEVSS